MKDFPTEESAMIMMLTWGLMERYCPYRPRGVRDKLGTAHWCLYEVRDILVPFFLMVYVRAFDNRVLALRL